MKYYPAIKKVEILSFATTWVDLKGIRLSEMSQMGKNKYHMNSLRYDMYSKTKQNK